MNCLLKEREKAAAVAETLTLEEREEMRELTILLEGRHVAEDYHS